MLAGRLQLGSVVGPSLSEISPDATVLLRRRGHRARAMNTSRWACRRAAAPRAGGSFAALSAEVRGKVTDKISLVGFYDLGFVDADSFVSGSSSRHAGAGIGLRYDVAGIGPIRLDRRLSGGRRQRGRAAILYRIGQAFETASCLFPGRCA